MNISRKQFHKMNVPEAMDTTKQGRSWPIDEITEVISSGSKPGSSITEVTRSGGNIQNHWYGAIQAETTSGMINHMRKFHSDSLPHGVSAQRKRSEDQLVGATRPNMGLVRDWAQHYVFGALLPVRLIDDSHTKALFGHRLPGVGSSKLLRETMRTMIGELKVSVQEIMQQVKQMGIQLVLSGDTWKPKTKRRPHFLAVYCDWTSMSWSHEHACIYCEELPAARLYLKWVLSGKYGASIFVRKLHTTPSGTHHQGVYQQDSDRVM